MLAAQGMKAVANLFQPEAPTAPETLDRPHLAVPGGSGYPRRDGNSAGSRILASIWPYLGHVAFKVLSSDASLSLSFLTFIYTYIYIYFYYTLRFCLCLLVLMFSITL